MEILKYTSEDSLISHWKGGKTSQISIWPEYSSFEKRDFIWRISTATIEVDESDFTVLPGYERIIFVLEGEVILSYEGERITRLSKYQQDRFSGSARTKSYGKIEDFNLIYKTNADAYLELIEAKNENTPIGFENHLSDEYELETNFFHCCTGYGIITFNEKEIFIKNGDTLVLSGETKESISIGIMGEGQIVHGIIRFDNENKKEEVISIKEKATFDDFKLSALISLTSIRGIKNLSNFRKSFYFDTELKKSINKIESTMVTFIVGLIGIVFISAFSLKNLGNQYVLPLLVFWMLIDFFIINPSIYMAWLPKPIRRHIKAITDLTEEEKNLIKDEKSKSEVAEKILKKYKINGRN